MKKEQLLLRLVLGSPKTKNKEEHHARILLE